MAYGPRRSRYRSTWNTVRKTASKYGPRLATAAVSAWRKSGSRQSTNRGLRTSAPALITGENDWSNVYRKRSMPRRRRRQWVSFVRKTKAVISKSLAPSFLVRLRQANVVTTANKQNATSVHTILGGYSGDPTTSDIAAIEARVGAIATPLGAYAPDRFTVTGWLAETQVVNYGTTTAYVDMYYWRTKRSTPGELIAPTQTLTASVFSLWNWDLQEQGSNAPSGGSALDVFDYGVTPFQTNAFPKFVNIYRKRRVRLGAGGTVQIEQRSGKNYYMNNDYNSNFGMIAGKTEGIFCICYGVPSATNPVADPVSVRFSTNINYTYRLLENSRVTGGTTQA